MTGAETIPGTVLKDEIVAAGAPWAGIVKQGQVLRIVDLEGQQGVDFLCFNAERPEERYHAANTIKRAGTISLGKGLVLYSDEGRALFTIIEDTCGGHDTIAGCCSNDSNRLIYGEARPGCRENFLAALGAFGLGRRDIVANVNFFCSFPVGEGGRLSETLFEEGASQAGDFVDLEAGMDALAAISNCPQIANPCSGLNPTPIRVVIWSPD